MEARREAEPDAGLLDATRDASGVELERDAERFEQVRGTARRRRGAVAVLAHRHARAGDDERGQRRHVDRVAAIAAGAHDIDELLVHRRRHLDDRRDGEHRVEEPVELLDGLALHPQRDDEPGDLRGRRGAFEDLGHRGPRLAWVRSP